MNYTFSCNHCEGHIGADETFVGEEVECPHCGETITVPSQESSESLDEPLADELPPVPGSKADKNIRSRKLSMSAKIAWGSGFALLGLVVWQFASLGGDKRDDAGKKLGQTNENLGMGSESIEQNEESVSQADYDEYMKGYNDPGMAMVMRSLLESGSIQSGDRRNVELMAEGAHDRAIGEPPTRYRSRD